MAGEHGLKSTADFDRCFSAKTLLSGSYTTARIGKRRSSEKERTRFYRCGDARFPEQIRQQDCCYSSHSAVISALIGSGVRPICSGALWLVAVKSTVCFGGRYLIEAVTSPPVSLISEPYRMSTNVLQAQGWKASGGGSVSDYATTRELVQLQKQFMLVWCQKIMA